MRLARATSKGAQCARMNDAVGAELYVNTPVPRYNGRSARCPCNGRWRRSLLGYEAGERAAVRLDLAPVKLLSIGRRVSGIVDHDVLLLARAA